MSTPKSVAGKPAHPYNKPPGRRVILTLVRAERLDRLTPEQRKSLEALTQRYIGQFMFELEKHERENSVD